MTNVYVILVLIRQFGSKLTKIRFPIAIYTPILSYSENYLRLN